MDCPFQHRHLFSLQYSQILLKKILNKKTLVSTYFCFPSLENHDSSSLFQTTRRNLGGYEACQRQNCGCNRPFRPQAITSLGSLLAVPPIAVELLSDAPEPTIIWRWLAVAVGMVAIAFTSRGLAFYMSHIAAFKLEVILRTALTEHLAQAPLGYVITTGLGAIKKLVQDDVKSLHAFVAAPL